MRVLIDSVFDFPITKDYLSIKLSKFSRLISLVKKKYLQE